MGGTAVLVAPLGLNNLIKLQQWLNLRIPISSQETLELQLLSRCNVRPFAKTDSSCWREELAKLLRCRLPRRASTDTPRSIWLELISSTERNLKISVLQPTTWMSQWSKEDYTLVDIIEGYLTLMSDNGDLREDLKCPDGDIGNQIKTDFENGR